MVYLGDLLEVEFLLTGKRFRKGIPIEVNTQEYQYLKDHPDFKVEKAVKSKKGDDK